MSPTRSPNHSDHASFASTSKVSFADVAHQNLIFDRTKPAEQLVLELIDTPWVQRLRHISQTGNTRLVYMFAEHSRFGHSLGVAYLATTVMKQLATQFPEAVRPFELAVAAAAVLHDIGHVSPGSHLAERIWSRSGAARHEQVGIRVLNEDEALRKVLTDADPALPAMVSRILTGDPSLPPWPHALISGEGWNADRGNWAIVDSAMCAVTYGRYNVDALVDAFRLTSSGELVLHESRLDALTHFFVARDSMYRQIYQHRVLQAADALTEMIVIRIRDIIDETHPELTRTTARIPETERAVRATLDDLDIFADDPMLGALSTPDYCTDLPLSSLFQMTEGWWSYHIEQWCNCSDFILADLARRSRDRVLFKTIRLAGIENPAADGPLPAQAERLIADATSVAKELGYDPEYYVTVVDEADTHRGRSEQPPLVLMDSGEVVPATEVEPLIAQILSVPPRKRRWLAVPKEIKDRLGRLR